MFGQKKGLLDVFKKPVDPKELVRKWQSDLRQEQRGLERQIREIDREKKNAEKQVSRLVLGKTTSTMWHTPSTRCGVHI